jgi:hypothetical protein
MCLRVTSVKMMSVGRLGLSVAQGKSVLSTLFSETLSLCSSLKVRDQVSHPYRTTGKITVLFILIFSFLIWDVKTKDFGRNDNKHSLNLIYSCNLCPSFKVRDRVSHPYKTDKIIVLHILIFSVLESRMITVFELNNNNLQNFFS